jgi:2,3-bisphosphoglycerate-dependent phosphoglycerate mutase
MASTYTLIEFAGKKVGIAAPQGVQAFFATVTYRLEPQGRGSRFPIVMNRLYAGGLDESDLLAAGAELDAIAAELRRIHAGKAIGSLDNLEPFSVRAPLVNERAGSLFDYFVAAGGTPLVVALRSAVEQARVAGSPLKLHSPEVERNRKGAVLSMVFGLAWSAIGYVYFRDYVIVPGGSHSHSGLLVWPIGLPIAALGAVALLPHKGRIQTLSRRHEWLAVVAGMALILLWAALTWRG